MQKIIYFSALLFASFILMQSCQNTTVSNDESYTAEWLGENKQEIIDNIEEQLQGFSRTMVETGYRYKELYWAGMDNNWEYADYQREHIMEAMDQGFIRRPERIQSAQQFMNVALPAMEEAIISNDPEKFLSAFTSLTSSCNTCHAMEEVAFMTVKIPTVRNTVVYF
jgi:hypothetical protein